MSKVVDAVKSGVKSIVRGVKKVFKKVTESKIGRVVLAAAAIYLTGGALGAWSTPWASVNGAFVGGASKAAAGTVNLGSLGSSVGAGSATAAGTGTVNLGTLGSAAAGTGAGSAGFTAAGTTAAGAGAGAAATSAAAASGAHHGFTAAGMTASGSSAAGGAGTASTLGTAGTMNLSSAGTGAGGFTTATETGKGIIGSALGKTAAFAKENPFLTYMGMNAISSATSPDEMDMIRAQEESAIRLRNDERDFDEKERKRREANLLMAGIDFGTYTPAGQRITDMYGTPITNGIINSRRG